VELARSFAARAIHQLWAPLKAWQVSLPSELSGFAGKPRSTRSFFRKVTKAAAVHLKGNAHLDETATSR